jgi:thiosulfate/3-mercaptopyruvate sulfurtransferase
VVRPIWRVGKIMGHINIMLARCLLLALALDIFLGIALAGTETGEFCPTCPDWTDLDGWLVKKEAYERAQMNGVQQPSSVDNAAAAQAETAVEKPKPTYPAAGIIAHAGSYPFGGYVILDVREPEDYRKGHIPGARNLYWMDLFPGDSLDIHLAEGMMGAVGINSSDSILIYGDDDEGADCVFWILCYLGHGNLSKLDGGVDAAWGRGIVPDKSVPSVAVSDYTARLQPGLMVNESRLENLLMLPAVQILDARDFADYGRSRLTNASVPMSADKLYDDLMIKDVSSLKELLERRSLEKNSTQLVYGTPQAYSLFFGLRLMGYNVTLIQGDWWQRTEWAVSNVR